MAIPLGPIARSRALGAAIGGFLAGLDRRVLLLASGGLSHDPPVPTLASAPAAARAASSTRTDGARGPHRPPATGGGRRRGIRRGCRIVPAAEPGLGRRPAGLLDTGNLAAFDGWTNDRIAAEAGNSAHEVRTWVAAFAALATAGPYRTGNHYYRPAPELIAGFAIRTAVPV
ncbi:DODA-type extradiol aromatic ring-opening family dioxygenase [Mycolicibacterium insubricum]|uniref:DODA-type extradiol aromatic ring-opening family dioxygenase n=1 Tax=Mycolicibacterium insubricum TaxID=444597 RepID=UPI0021F3745B|nr:hypothetical protein [Mycolicibacterium insubricum]